MNVNRRSLLAAGGLAMAGPAATGTAVSGASLYFPPGCRLGLLVPDAMAPLTGDPRNLLAADHTFQILFWEPPAFGGSYDADTWNDRPNRVTLLSEQTVSPGEQRRLFERSDFAGDASHSWFSFLVRTSDTSGRTDWFGRLSLMTKPMAHSTGERARWRDTIGTVVASVAVRPALSVAEMLAEHGIVMDLSGLHPHHFGNKLVASLAAPRTRVESWTNDCYLAMEEPPVLLPYPWDREPALEEVAAATATYKASFRALRRTPYAEWTTNGVEWIAENEQLLAGTATHVREAQGFARRRMIRLRSYCRANRAAIGAALDRVARSVKLDP